MCSNYNGFYPVINQGFSKIIGSDRASPIRRFEVLMEKKNFHPVKKRNQKQSGYIFFSLAFIKIAYAGSVKFHHHVNTEWFS
jgi:hypothetical protein